MPYGYTPRVTKRLHTNYTPRVTKRLHTNYTPHVTKRLHTNYTQHVTKRLHTNYTPLLTMTPTNNKLKLYLKFFSIQLLNYFQPTAPVYVYMYTV
jgi:hypothetical protein